MLGYVDGGRSAELVNSNMEIYLMMLGVGECVEHQCCMLYGTFSFLSQTVNVDLR